MQERRIRGKQTAFHFSWIRLPELHGLHLFSGRKLEEFVLQDHCGIMLERENEKVIGRMVVPVSPWRRLSVYLDDSKDTFDLVQNSIDPNRNFSHHVAVPRGLSDKSFYYSATRDFLFSTTSEPRIWYDTELQISLRGDYGEVIWTLTQLVDRSEAQIHQLFINWHRFVKNRERMACSRNETTREEFRRVAHMSIAAIKEAWGTERAFKPVVEIDPEGDLNQIRAVLRKCFPDIYHHYIDHPPEPVMFRRCPEREYRVEARFVFDPKDAESDQPVYPTPTDPVRLIIPPNTFNNSTPKRCYSFYGDIVGFVPDAARRNGTDRTKVVEIGKTELHNSAEFWGDIAEVIKAFYVYREEMKEKLPSVVSALEAFRGTNYDRGVLVR